MRIKGFQQKGKRDYQQDHHWHEETLGIFLVCDGMGGAVSGDVASKIVVDTISEKVKNGMLPSTEENTQQLVTLAELALSKRLKTHPGERGAGTTLALLFIQNNQATIAHIGDSRIYHIRPAENYIWHTKDHSFVQELFNLGVLTTEAEMLAHPQRNQLTKVLKVSEKTDLVRATISTISPVIAGDIFLLCSDGMLEPFTAASLGKILLNPSLSLFEKVEQIRSQCAEESSDNNTAYFIEI